MTIPFPIKSTIDSRRSVRSYKMTGVEKDLMDTIKDYAKSLSVPFDHNRDKILQSKSDKSALYNYEIASR